MYALEKELKKFIRWLYNNNRELYRIMVHDGWSGAHNRELDESEALEIVDEYLDG